MCISCSPVRLKVGLVDSEPGLAEALLSFKCLQPVGVEGDIGGGEATHASQLLWPQSHTSFLLTLRW